MHTSSCMPIYSYIPPAKNMRGWSETCMHLHERRICSCKNDWGHFSAPFVVAKLHGNLPAHHVCKLEAMTMTDVQRQLSWPWPHNRDEHITYGSELVIGRLEEDASIKIFFFIVSEFAWHWLNAENMVLAYDWYHIFICPPTKNIRYMP